MKIYTYPENPRVYKALIAAKYVGVEIEVPTFEMGTDNKTPEFLKKNPLGKVPVLETDDGNSVFESNAIARYVARLNPSANLFGKSVYEAALVDQWVDFTVGEIDLPANAWLLPISGFIPNNPQATAKAVQDIRKVLTILNNHLATRTFLVGERVTLADIIVVCSLFKLYQMVLDASFRKPFANANRWFMTCVHQPQFKAVLGDVHLCEKAAQAGDEAPKAAKKEQQPKKEQPKKEEKKEQPKKEEKKEQPKKEEKKEEKEEEEEDYEEKPKTKNPLDLLPKSTFDIEEWKRTYSNKDTRKEAIPWLWSNFDSEGYSIWFADYKYNDELASVLYACNLAGGFIQRLDRLRKYGFATLVIFGTSNPDVVLSGVFIVRGKEIPFELSDAPDFESYSFKKVDLNDAAQKTLVENYLAWDGEFPHGKAVNQGKVFK